MLRWTRSELGMAKPIASASIARKEANAHFSKSTDCSPPYPSLLMTRSRASWGHKIDATRRARYLIANEWTFPSCEIISFATADSSIDMDMLELRSEGDISDSRGIPLAPPSLVLFFAKAMPSNSRACSRTVSPLLPLPEDPDLEAFEEKVLFSLELVSGVLLLVRERVETDGTVDSSPSVLDSLL